MSQAKNQKVSIRVPQKLIADFDGKLKKSIDGIQSKRIKTEERTLCFVSLLCEKGYEHWLDGKHPRIAIKSGTLQQLLGFNYAETIEMLEKNGVVQANHSYLAGQFCKHYWLDKEYLKEGMIDYVLTDRFMINRYLKMLGDRI